MACIVYFRDLIKLLNRWLHMFYLIESILLIDFHFVLVTEIIFMVASSDDFYRWVLLIYWLINWFFYFIKPVKGECFAFA